MSGSTAGSLSFLVITPTDMEKLWNSSEHARVRRYAEQGIPMTVAHFRHNTSPRLSDLMRDAFTFRTRERRDGETRYLQIDPFFNYCGGMRTQSDARVKADATTYDPPPTANASVKDGAVKRRRMPLRHYLIRALSPLAVLRDVFLTPCYVAAVLARTRGERFDAALCIGPWASLVGWILKHLRKVNVVVYEDRDYEPGLLPDRLRKWYTGLVERALQRRADVVISVGFKLAALRKEQSGIDPVVISNGMEWDRMAAARETSGRGRTLVYVGNLSSWSGVEHNIRAMPELVKTFPDVHLLVVGSGDPDYETFLRRLAADLGVASCVEFSGSQPHERLAEFLGRGAIGLANSEPVPYRRYACPLKVIEYMAAGLPVLATVDTEAADMVDRYRSGIAASYDVAAITNALERLLGDREMYEVLRNNAMDQSRRLDWRVLLEREQDLIEKALTRARSKRRMHMSLEEPSCA